MSTKRRFWAALAVIVFFWGILFLPHLRTSPHWYGDETIAVLLAKNLAAGQMGTGAVFNTFLTAVYQPLYLAAIALGWAVSGDILGTRFINTLLALGTSLVLWLLGRRIVPGRAAFAAALVFLAYDQSVLHFRQTFAHNGLTFGAALAVLAVSLPSRDRLANWLAGIGVVVAIGSHPLGIYVAAVAGLARILQPRTWPALLVPSAVTFLIAYGFSYALFGNWLIEDFFTLGASYASYGEENRSQLWLNLARFYLQDGFHLLGVFGVLAMGLLPGRRRRWPLVVFSLLFSVALLSNRSNLVVFYYQAVPLLPFLALGLVFALDQALRIGGRRFQALRFLRRWVPVVALVFAIPLLGRILSGELRQRNFPWVTRSIPEVEAAARWINERTNPSDVVVANSNIAWLLDARVADMFQWTTWDGLRTFMYVKPLPRERFRYALDKPNIRYLVLGDIDLVWGVHQENIGTTLEKNGVATWPVVWSSEFYHVLENPDFAGKR